MNLRGYFRGALTGAAFVSLLLGSQHVVAADKVEIIVRAFIPKTHSSTRKIPQGNGDTMVEPPASSIVGCFRTDQRGFSSGEGASSRIASMFSITFDKPPGLAQKHPTFESNAIDCGNGEVINKETTSNADQKATLKVNPAGVASVTYHASGTNPNLTWAPSIDIDGVFTVDLTAKTVKFVGKIDEYPAYEAYARLNGGPWRTLLQVMPAYGKSAMDLGSTISIEKGASL